VMAAWLAYLKSRLLLPDAPSNEEGPSAEEMANALAWRLKRLEAFRAVADQLMERPQLNRDVFGRGDPEPISDIRHPEWTATLYDLLTAYASQRQKAAFEQVQFKARNVWALVDAREALTRLVGQAGDWATLDSYLASYLDQPEMRTSVMASSFAATLELVRDGQLELHQHEAFAPIYMRRRETMAQAGPAGSTPALRVVE